MPEPRCMFCDGPINPEVDYDQVTGFRRRRSQGGTNALRLSERTSKWACFRCVDKQARGVAIEQQELSL